MNHIETELLSADDVGIARAVDLLGNGAQVALPTETVYGLAADARNGEAVAGIYAAKGRPSFNPLIVHVADVDSAKRYVDWTDTADQLAQAFWPGPLTMVLPMRHSSGISPLVTAGLDTLAIRVPAHPVARALLAAFDGPLAAPSANPSGRISPTTAAHVMDGLQGRIAAIVDGGACEVGVESTILNACATPPILLRPGGVASESIAALIGQPMPKAAEGDAITAPGQLLSHYAPDAPIRLSASEWRPGEMRLGFGNVPCDLNLSAKGDLREAAANLFGHLHALDGPRPIAVSPISNTGLGVAINDRLQRAAAPRDEN